MSLRILLNSLSNFPYRNHSFYNRRIPSIPTEVSDLHLFRSRQRTTGKNSFSCLCSVSLSRHRRRSPNQIRSGREQHILSKIFQRSLNFTSEVNDGMQKDCPTLSWDNNYFPNKDIVNENQVFVV